MVDSINKPTAYRADIDGLRAVAVLSVMLYHLNSAWLPGGFVGVDVFFVISGFVVTASLVHSQCRSFPEFIASFYARRLARIVPALVTTLLISSFVATLFIPKAWLSDLNQETARYAYFGLSNWVLQRNSDFYFAPRAEFNPYTHTWSLGVEEQFYLIVPLILFFWACQRTASHGRSQRVVALILASICLASLVFCIWVSHANAAIAFYSIGARFWELGLGALLFLLTQSATARSYSVPLKLGAVSPYLGIIILLAAFVWSNPNAFPWPWALLPVIATLLLIGGNEADDKHPIRRILATPILVWVGLRSYSLYLWHWPVYVLLRWTVGLESMLSYAIGLGLTLLLSMFSYRWIETPFRHHHFVLARPKLAQILFFIALIVAGFFTSNYFFSHPREISLSKVSRQSQDWVPSSLSVYPQMKKDQCQTQVASNAFEGGNILRITPSKCRDQLTGGTVYVLGDSHAGMLVPAFERLSAEQGKQIEIFMFAGCSYINFKAPMQGQFTEECLRFNRAAQEYIISQSKPDDLVVLPSLRMERYGDQWVSFKIANMYDHMYNADALIKRKAALPDAQAWLEPFIKKNLSVLFVAPPPIFQAPNFRCADWFNRHNPICIGSNQQNRAELERLRAPVLNAMDTLSHDFPGISVWDPFPVLCPNEVCSTFVGDKPLFFDGDHLSNYANLVIYPGLLERVKQLTDSSPLRSSQ